MAKQTAVKRYDSKNINQKIVIPFQLQRLLTKIAKNAPYAKVSLGEWLQ